MIPGEDDEFGPTHYWCEDPAPDEHCDPADAVEYVRKEHHVPTSQVVLRMEGLS
jgi:hypothetical protein